MKYFALIAILCLLMSCSEPPTRDNPYDLEYFQTFSPVLNWELLCSNTIKLTWEWDYEIELIDGFRIEKKAYNVISWSLYVDNITAELREWEDDNFTYLDSYRIKAYYQEHESKYSNIVLGEFENMIYVEGGTYEMGDHFNEGDSNELPLHEVTLSSFYIGKYEVTQGEYEELMGTNPAYDYGVGDEYPVHNVSWYDAVEYCNALSEQQGFTSCYNLSDYSCDFSANGFRLPTEAEWEYAARGGVNWTDNHRYSGTTDHLIDYAWYYDNSGYQTHEAGTKSPNKLGIYDMSGNVWEWCNDWYLSDYYDSSSGTDPLGPESGSSRVFRGGAWNYIASYSRTANRYYFSPGSSFSSLGFRLARSSD